MKSIVGVFAGTVRFAAAAALIAVTACGGAAKPAPERCLAPSQVEASAPVTRLGVHFVAGTTPLTAGNEARFASGARFKPTKARFYLAGVALVDEAGKRVAAELVDVRGERLPYGVALVDFERPESMNVYLKAAAGRYRALAVAVGVPASCESGEELNHSDASAMKPPLDVDSDMYWTWNAGYVFLKFEGQIESGGKWEGFFYHVGDDDRFVALELPRDFTITAEGGAGPEIVADFERLLTSAAGAARPDVTNGDQRRVHGGEWADALADNIRRSGFLRLDAGHH